MEEAAILVVPGAGPLQRPRGTHPCEGAIGRIGRLRREVRVHQPEMMLAVVGVVLEGAQIVGEVGLDALGERDREAARRELRLVLLAVRPQHVARREERAEHRRARAFATVAHDGGRDEVHAVRRPARDERNPLGRLADAVGGEEPLRQEARRLLLHAGGEARLRGEGRRLPGIGSGLVQPPGAEAERKAPGRAAVLHARDGLRPAAPEIAGHSAEVDQNAPLPDELVDGLQRIRREGLVERVHDRVDTALVQ